MESVLEIDGGGMVTSVSESAYWTATEFALTIEKDISWTTVWLFESTLVPFAVVRDPTLLTQE